MEKRFSYSSSLDGVADGGTGSVGFEEARMLHIDACLLVCLTYELYLHVLAWLCNATACIAVLVHADRPDQSSNRIAIRNCLR